MSSVRPHLTFVPVQAFERLCMLQLINKLYKGF